MQGDGDFVGFVDDMVIGQHIALIFINKDLMEGHILEESDFDLLRPLVEISPMQLPQIVGKTLQKSVKMGSPLTPSDFKPDRSQYHNNNAAHWNNQTQLRMRTLFS